MPRAYAETTDRSYLHQLSVIEDQLADVKEDILQQLRSSAQANLPVDVGLKEIADLMTRLERPGGQELISKRKGRNLAPDHIWVLLADQLFEANLVRRAEALLKRTANLSPHEQTIGGAWFRLEKSHYRKGKYQEALGSFLKISDLENFSEWEEATYLAGNSYLYLKEDLKAIKFLSLIPKKSEFYPFALYSIGLAYLNFDDSPSKPVTPKRTSSLGYEEVIPDPGFPELLDLNPREDKIIQELMNRAHLTLGAVQVDKNQNEEALIHLQKIPSWSLYWFPARFAIGKIFMESKGCIKSITVFRQLIDRAPDHPHSLEALLNVGTCYSKLNAHRRAIHSFRLALQAYSARREVLNKLIEEIPGFKLRQMASPSDFRAVDKELVLKRDFPEFDRVYQEWFYLNEQIARLDQTSGVTVEYQTRMKVIQKKLEEVFRTVMDQMFSVRIEQLDNLIVQAYLGLAKDTIYLQDRGLTR